MSAEDQFNALVLNKEDGQVSSSINILSVDDLPEGDVTVAVDFTTLNYKDALVLKGQGGLVRNYPHVPGIDFAGVVKSSNSDDFKEGDWVVLTGWRVGEVHWGGYAQKARVKSDWLVPLPDGISSQQAMNIGTAGFTAMLAVMALEDHGLTPDIEGEVLVTGAAGGVGSVATAILSNLGYQVAAGTGRADTHDYLKSLGAASIVGRNELETPGKGPLGSEKWAGAIDSVGGSILANLLANIRYRGNCAAVGLAASPKLQTTVIPFIIRGVNLLGIDSVMCPQDRRIEAWNRLATDLPLDKLAETMSVVPLTEVADLAGDILKGQVKGRVVVDVNG
ncbi:MAG: oxidoreductase [Rhodospirillaceae bacterium]|jgi:acrylyl-CoA reductase (NADPH)|nr:oxidoreductase [Rhodospirillaceae bacterium]